MSPGKVPYEEAQTISSDMTGHNGRGSEMAMADRLVLPDAELQMQKVWNGSLPCLNMDAGC
jgi:hypothetical protein